jgi:hypothetical protein
MNTIRALSFLVQALSLAPAIVAAEPPSGNKSGSPVEPISAMLTGFQRHSIIALGEGSHGNEPGHRFRVALIRDRRFAETVNDIVVEFGNSRFQDVMDRYVRGENVPYESLRHVWMDTTQPDTIWDVPIYEQFFKEVRRENEVLPEAKKIRVLLGDPRSIGKTSKRARILIDLRRDVMPTPPKSFSGRSCRKSIALLSFTAMSIWRIEADLSRYWKKRARPRFSAFIRRHAPT